MTHIQELTNTLRQGQRANTLQSHLNELLLSHSRTERSSKSTRLTKVIQEASTLVWQRIEKAHEEKQKLYYPTTLLQFIEKKYQLPAQHTYQRHPSKINLKVLQKKITPHVLVMPLEQAFNTGQSLESQLFDAIDKDDRDAVGLLIRKENLNINCTRNRFGIEYECPLSHAIKLKRNEIVSILLNHPKINIHLRPRMFFESPLIAMIIEKNIDVVMMVLKLPHLLKTNGFEHILNFATQEGLIDLVQQVIALPAGRAALNSPIFCKYTALHTAIENNHLEILQLLLQPELQIKLDVTTYTEETALHLAAKKGNIAVVNLLLQ